MRPTTCIPGNSSRELARDARDGAGIVDLRDPYKPSRPISIVADTIHPDVVRRAMRADHRTHGDHGDTIGKLHAFVTHAANDLAYDHVKPMRHVLPDGGHIERYSPEDVQKLKDTQQRIKVELLRKLGYHGIVYHNAAGQVVYRPLDEGEQPDGCRGNRRRRTTTSNLSPRRTTSRSRDTGGKARRCPEADCRRANPGQADGRGRRPGHQQALRQ